MRIGLNAAVARVAAERRGAEPICRFLFMLAGLSACV